MTERWRGAGAGVLSFPPFSLDEQRKWRRRMYRSIFCQILPCHYKRRRTLLPENTFFTLQIPCSANSPSVRDDLRREFAPLFPRKRLHQIQLNPFWIFVTCE